MNRFKDSALVFIGAALWGIEAIFVPPMTAGGFTTMQISFLGAFVSAVVVVIFALIKDRSAFRFSRRDGILLLALSMTDFIFFKFFYYTTINNSEVSVAVMLLYSSPIFIMLFSRIVFRERMTPRKYLCLALTVIGCVCVSGYIGHAVPIPLFALFTGIMTGAVYGVYAILTRLTARSCGPLTVCMYMLIFGTIILLPVCHPGQIVSVLKSNHTMIPYALTFGPVCAALANGLYAWGISGISANRAAILGAAEPLTAAVLGILLFHESREPVKLVGIALIIAAIIIQGLEQPGHSSASDR